MLEINGVEIVAPKIFKVDIHDIDGESTRNAKGDLIRDRISTKTKLICEWPPLELEEISILLKSVKDIYFTVKYPDPMEGKFVSKTFYVGDRSAPMYWYDKTKNKSLWKGLNMNFIER